MFFPNGVADMTVMVSSPLCRATSSLKSSITPSASPKCPFSDSALKRFFVTLEIESLSVPSSLVNRSWRPSFRFCGDKVGLFKNDRIFGFESLIQQLLQLGVDFGEGLGRF